MKRWLRQRRLYFGENRRRLVPVLGGLVIIGTLGVMINNWRPTAAIVASDGLVLYGASGNTNPQWRSYTSPDSFGAAGGTVNGTVPLAAVVKTSPIKNEAVAGYVNASGVLQVMCYDGTTWSNEWSVTVGGTGTTRRFDIAYERNSGKVIVLYGNNGANLGYRTKLTSAGCGGANWAAATTFTPSRTSGTVSWVRMSADARSSSNLIAAAWADSASDLSSRIWSGSAWGNEPTAALSTTLEVAAAAQDVDSFDIVYESLSGDIMVAWGNVGTTATNLLNYKVCTGGTSTCSWGATTAFGFADTATHIDLGANPLSDEITMASINNSSDDLSAAYWSGSTWTNYADLDTTTEDPAAGNRVVSVGWLTNGSATRWFLNYDDATGTGLSLRTAIPGSAPTNPGDVSVTPLINDIRHRYALTQNPHNNAEAMLLLTDSTAALFAKRVTLDGLGNFTWTNADGGASLGTVAQASVGDFSFAYWRYIPPATDVQSAYRLFNNADSTDVGSALAAQDTPSSLTSAGASFRLRLLMHRNNTTMTTNGQNFKLQFAGKGTGTCAAPSGGTPASYTDITTSTAISYRDNATPADGATLTGNAGDPTHGGDTVVNQTYEEANNFTNSVAAINSGQDGKWDFALYDNGASAGATYCMRAVKSDGTTTDMSFDSYPEITTYSSVVTIDSFVGADAFTQSTNGTGTVFTSDSTGYAFYVDSSETCVYSKTTNGGISWGAAVSVNTVANCQRVQAWYDQWTPGDTTGGNIHLATINADLENVYYSVLDTSTDTLTASAAAPLDISSDKTNTFTANAVRPSIVKGTDNTLYIAITDSGTAGDESWVKKCSSGCTTVSNWIDASTGDAFTAHDEVHLMPLPAGDILMVHQDIGNDDILSKVYDAGTSTWDASFTTIDANAPEQSTVRTYAGRLATTIDLKTNNIYLSYDADTDIFGTNDDIRTAVYSGGTWTLKTDILTNDARGITRSRLAFDENTGAIYALYTVQATPDVENTASIYWKKSTDGMTTWSSASLPINTSADFHVGAQLNIMSDERIYVTWKNDTNEAFYGATIADLTPPTYEQSGFRLFNNTDTTDVGTALAVQDTAATLAAANDPFRLRALLHVNGDGARTDLHQFKLQYAGKGTGTCAAPSGGTPSSYTDVTASTLIAFNNNATPADEAALTPNANDPVHSGHTPLSTQSYQEANNFSNSMAAIDGNKDGLWDFALKDNAAASNTAYCLRIVKSDGTALTSYGQYPQITTAASSANPTLEQQLRGGQSVMGGFKTPFRLN